MITDDGESKGKGSVLSIDRWLDFNLVIFNHEHSELDEPVL